MLQSVMKYFWNPEEVESKALTSEGNAAESVLEDQSLSKTVRGVITSLAESHGLIEGNIYFDKDVTIKFESVKVGDTVLVQASRVHEKAGWTAKQVWKLHQETSPTDNATEWKEEASKCCVQTRDESAQNVETVNQSIGEVTYVQSHRGQIYGNINFTFTNCINGFKPRRGDWVKFSMIKRDYDVVSVSDISPLRSSAFEGIVTLVRQDGSGAVNDDILFNRDVISGGMRLREGNQVCGEMIETSRKWRALSIRPISEHLTY